MIVKFLERLSTPFELTISSNKVHVLNPKNGTTASEEGPFSCSHSLVSDVDILEEMVRMALKRANGSPWFLFRPAKLKLDVTRPLHHWERHLLGTAVENAGASSVIFDPHLTLCDENDAKADAWVVAYRKRRGL
ncbi:hypothetical protein [Sphingomicrobium marinum]|uniref:hypothetical protein n=1 Tax=Sphingomicrobium marinum TaxID=1227950 RepID=UPI00223F4CB2|nr:hypothetical protein [Sphingomicrobium marinum]